VVEFTNVIAWAAPPYVAVVVVRKYVPVSVTVCATDSTSIKVGEMLSIVGAGLEVAAFTVKLCETGVAARKLAFPVCVA
jgi:hypothetical protein